MSDMTSDASRTGFAVFTDLDWAAGSWSEPYMYGMAQGNILAVCFI